MLKKLPNGAAASLFNKLGHGEFACLVYAPEEIEFSFGSPYHGDSDMEEPDEVTFELLAPRLVPFDIRQARDAISSGETGGRIISGSAYQDEVVCLFGELARAEGLNSGLGDSCCAIIEGGEFLMMAAFTLWRKSCID